MRFLFYIAHDLIIELGLLSYRLHYMGLHVVCNTKTLYKNFFYKFS
ncbi:hypothetical protein LALCM10_170027 [Dellaglioa algida]|nr:hypothetical protein LALCM10_170027 [Dellaglioa algida]